MREPRSWLHFGEFSEEERVPTLRNPEGVYGPCRCAGVNTLCSKSNQDWRTLPPNHTKDKRLTESLKEEEGLKISHNHVPLMRFFSFGSWSFEESPPFLLVSPAQNTSCKKTGMYFNNLHTDDQSKPRNKWSITTSAQRINDTLKRSEESRIPVVPASPDNQE